MIFTMTCDWKGIGRVRLTEIVRLHILYRVCETEEWLIKQKIRQLLHPYIALAEDDIQHDIYYLNYILMNINKFVSAHAVKCF